MAELTTALETIFRRDRARVVGALMRAFGSLEAAEEAFQEALLAALKTWPEQGVPEEPVAWLITAAKNHVRDALRHRRVARAKAALLASDDMNPATDTFETIRDDELRLIFACCHPAIPRDSQVALTLKVVAGFTTEEIARAFVTSEATIAQRIVRAKRTIDEKSLSYETPGAHDLDERLSAVLAVVYLVFNEGHTSRSGELMRLDLQREALRLGRVLCDLVPRASEVFALHALMAFGAARAETRTDEDGVLLLLSEQDRARWNTALIKEGLVSLQRARSLADEPGVHLLQAEIAACHTTAPSWERTDFRRILALYDALASLVPSPIVALNRAVAVCMVHGPEAAMRELEPLEAPLARYHLFHATRADFRRRLGLDPRADYERALAVATNQSERAFLKRRLDELASGS